MKIVYHGKYYCLFALSIKVNIISPPPKKRKKKERKKERKKKKRKEK
jgi:hypothetical protein